MCVQKKLDVWSGEVDIRDKKQNINESVLTKYSKSVSL